LCVRNKKFILIIFLKNFKKLNFKIIVNSYFN